MGEGIVTFGVQHRRREIDFAARAAELDGHAFAHLHAFELLEEVDVEERAAEFAVGDAVQAPVLLLLHDLANRFVFHCAQRCGVDLAFLAPGARLLEFLGTQEASDVIRAKRRPVAMGHCV